MTDLMIFANSCNGPLMESFFCFKISSFTKRCSVVLLGRFCVCAFEAIEVRGDGLWMKEFSKYTYRIYLLFVSFSTGHLL